MKKLIGLLTIFCLISFLQAGGLRFLQNCGQGQIPGLLWGCDDCADGYGSYPGATECYSCLSGYYLVGNNECEACPQGSRTLFDGGSGIAYSCNLCDNGSTNFGTGNSGCYTCGPNQYIVSNSACDYCPAGTTSPGGAATECTPTESGDSDSESTSLVCPEGFTLSADGTSCTCPGTTISSSIDWDGNMGIVDGQIVLTK